VTQKELTREIAYAIWEREGRPDGKDHDHWFRAEVVVRDIPPYQSIADLFEAGRSRDSPKREPF
jgi:Protein of unknown function (DUF2934)